MEFTEDAARSWMRGAVELARDESTDEVLVEELAERCALAFGVAGAGGPLDDAAHWLHRIAREVAAEAAPRGELLVVRIRAHGRTYWCLADGEERRSYGPRVSIHDAVERFQLERGRTYASVRKVPKHHSVTEAQALIERTFSRS